MTKILLVVWLIIGLLNLFTEVNKVDYFCVWFLLIMSYFEDLM
jgi:hypothetical protein